MVSRTDPAVKGIVRLINDAHLLLSHGRHQSAYVIALIGVEEIAKLVIGEWQAIGCFPIPKRRTSHLTKQAVFTAFLQAAAALPTWSTLMLEDNPSVELIEALQKSLQSSPHAEKEDAATKGMMEKAKQNALYFDGDAAAGSRETASITLADVNYFIAGAREAILLMADRKALVLGWAFYTARTSML